MDIPDQSGKKEKRFRCSHCQRPFARLEHLQRHERIHSGIKPFSCSECDHSFTRSDLLTRHERLTHQRHHEQGNHRSPIDDTNTQPSRKRTRSSIDFGSSENNTGYNTLATLSMAAEYQSLRGNMPDGTPLPSELLSPMNSGTSRHHNDAPESLHRLSSSQHISVPPEYEAFQRTMPDVAMSTELLSPLAAPQSSAVHQNGSSAALHAMEPPHPLNASNIDESLGSLTAFLDSEPLNAYHFASLYTEQPMPFFSPDSFGYGPEILNGAETTLHNSSHTTNWRPSNIEDTQTLSRFGSRFPSLQPEEESEEQSRQKSIADISHDDRQTIADKLREFSSVIPQDFKLPTRLALTRYIAAYITGFHEHMPFLHIPSMSVDACSIELILALAAIGAQYTFEGEKGVELFHVSRAIATSRIRRRDARLVDGQRYGTYENGYMSAVSSPHRSNSATGPLGLPSDTDAADIGDDLMQTAQALLLLMALCTWAKHKEILREALAIQSIIATLIRDDGLNEEPLPDNISWKDWRRRESIKRTKFIVYGFSNLHCIVYSIPPFLLTSEVKLTLPCSASEFKAPTEASWRQARKGRKPEISFQHALQRLFSKDGRDVTEANSSSGNYVLIHALIQHVFFLRQVARCRFDKPGELSAEDIVAIEVALRNWQIGWRQNPESSLEPISPDGPVAFNSTALLRLAYIRLYVDTPGRALETRDPVLIASAFRAGPAIKRSPKITRAVLHSAHALSIPIKIGYRLVAKTQSFIWSIQHSLCTLECAYLMSKWLEAMSNPDASATEDESKIIAIIKSMLDETEFAVDTPPETPGYTKQLSAGVLRVWAMIFKGSQTWAIVDVIGTALNLYAEMLES